MRHDSEPDSVKQRRVNINEFIWDHGNAKFRWLRGFVDGAVELISRLKHRLLR
jgi:hypothetical protein